MARDIECGKKAGLSHSRLQQSRTEQSRTDSELVAALLQLLGVNPGPRRSARGPVPGVGQAGNFIAGLASRRSQDRTARTIRAQGTPAAFSHQRKPRTQLAIRALFRRREEHGRRADETNSGDHWPRLCPAFRVGADDLLGSEASDFAGPISDRSRTGGASFDPNVKAEPRCSRFASLQAVRGLNRGRRALPHPWRKIDALGILRHRIHCLIKRQF